MKPPTFNRFLVSVARGDSVQISSIEQRGDQSNTSSRQPTRFLLLFAYAGVDGTHCLSSSVGTIEDFIAVSPSRLHQRITVSSQCITALHHWRYPSIIARGTPPGVGSARKVVTTDASLTGWGTVHEGRAGNRLWPPQLCHSQINCLKIVKVLLVPKTYFLWNCHILIRTDNTTVVAYINGQCGTCISPCSTSCYRVRKKTYARESQRAGPWRLTKSGVPH